ncbi:hypothetical protein DICPUDRAFT_96266 [Dictyostelium purpureum]|uniref:Uncharacterized protein n=1 Tax=Dictyostelium purpureum TaxID=5786 RepID=F0Z6U8_DICPU|nr:uncharacterized protein DICPUDRAFT_96266 [Dictyostelium purpureum]EGC40325.1 hypothetical protein DICPUDRAFT_96266 [Dictyostelium purpureum]|eukprot:XP_003283076.1 hypothetical protein DICPUDRAFT_96266 [Dictyostelium purpureum]
MDVYDESYEALTFYLSKYVDIPHYYETQLELKQMIKDEDKSDELKRILLLVKSPQESIYSDENNQNRFLCNPTKDHNIFKPIDLIIKEINKYVSIIKESQNYKNINFKKLEDLCNKHAIYLENFKTKLSEKVLNSKPSQNEPADIINLKKPIIFIDQELKYKQTLCLQTAYNLASYNIEEKRHVYNNVNGSSCGTILNDEIYLKIDTSDALLNPSKEFAIYHLNKLLFPHKLLTSPTQLFMLDKLKIVTPDTRSSSTMIDVSKKKEQLEKSTIAELIGILPPIHKSIDDSLVETRFFIQASLLQKGKTLNEYLENSGDNDKYDDLNLESFSSQVISSFLSIHTDYKPDNMIIKEGTNDIVCIDNDHSLKQNEILLLKSYSDDIATIDDNTLEVNLAEISEAVPSIKNILFTIKPLMIKPIHKNTVSQIIELSPPIILLKWLLKIHHQNSVYSSMISLLINPKDDTPEEKKKYIQNAEGELQVPLQFNSGWVQLMYQRFKLIKECLLSNKQMTHQELFEAVHPFTSIYYTLLSKDEMKPIKQIEIVYSSESIQSLFLKNKKNSKTSKEEIQKLIKESTYLKEKPISILNTIRELIENMEFNDLIECSFLSDSKCGSLCNKNCKTSKNFLEWFENIYSVFTSDKDKVNFHKSFFKNREVLIRLMRYGASANIIKNTIGFLEISINNENYISLINDSEILKEYPDCWPTIKFIIENYKLDLEVLDLDKGITLFDYTAKYNNLNVLINLIKKGAGKKANETIISLFYQNLSHKQKVVLRPYLEQLYSTNPLITWKISLDQLIPYENEAPKSFLKCKDILYITETQSNKRRILPKIYYNQMFDEKGEPIKKNLAGTRIVSKIKDDYGNVIYFKFMPQFPGIEIAVKMLSDELFNCKLTPNCELVSIDSKNIPVLISQKIPGNPLYKVLEKKPHIIKQIDPSNISQQLILAMIINNADGNLGNYIVTRSHTSNPIYKYKLYSIDNDQSFMPSMSFRKGNLQSETALFLFDQMNDMVHEDVIKNFENLEMYSIITLWLRKLSTYQNQSDTLFKLNNKSKNKECNTEITFNSKTVPDLYTKLRRLQKLLCENEPKTHLDILDYLEPVISCRHKPFLNLNRPIKERYNELNKYVNPSESKVSSSKNHTSDILKSRIYNKNSVVSKVMVDFFYKPESYNLLQVINDFKSLATKFLSLSLLIPAIEKNPKYIISNFELESLLEVDFSDYTKPQQDTLFSFIKSKKISTINIRNSNFLCSEVFNYFYHYKIVSLDLSGCKNLKNLGGGAIMKIFLVFNSLIDLRVDNCSSLESIHLYSPNLKFINSMGCKQINSIFIYPPNSRYLNLKGSINIKEFSFDVNLQFLQNFNNTLIEYLKVFKNSDLVESFHFKRTFNYFENLEYLNISDTQFNTITLNLKKLKQLDMFSMENLKTVFLELESIETINFEGCKSLKVISTTVKDEKINNNLISFLNRKIKKIKEKKISLNLIAAKQINETKELESIKDCCFLNNYDDYFILPLEISSTHYYQVDDNFSLSNIPTNITKITLCGNFNNNFYKGSLSDSVTNLSLFNIKDPLDKIVITPNIKTLCLGHGFDQIVTPEKIPLTIKKLKIGEIVYPIEPKPENIQLSYFKNRFNPKNRSNYKKKQ